MDLISAILLGLLQGITEFLPVSSSGHLLIAQKILGVNPPGMMVEVTLHLATVLSTIVVFRKDILQILTKTLTFKKSKEGRYSINILISLIPIMVVGLFFKDNVEAIFTGDLTIVGISLIVTSLLLFTSEKINKSDKVITPLRAFGIGMFQAIAVLPGLSRSGSTISGGLLLGVSKSEVAKFSFLMVLIPIMGDSFLEIVSGNIVSSGAIPITSLIAGFIAAFTSGLIACNFMVNLVRRSGLSPFAVYCLILGVITLTIL